MQHEQHVVAEGAPRMRKGRGRVGVAFVRGTKKMVDSFVDLLIRISVRRSTFDSVAMHT
jgi:hypothetical protein